MKSLTRHTGRILSVLLATAMFVTSAPQSVMTAYAAELSGQILPPPHPPAITDTEHTDDTGSAGSSAETDPAPAEAEAPTEALPEHPSPDDGQTEVTPPAGTPSEDTDPEDTPPAENKPAKPVPEETPPDTDPENTPPAGDEPAEPVPGETPPDTDPEDTPPAEIPPSETVSENTPESTPSSEDVTPTDMSTDNGSIVASSTGFNNPSVTWTLYQNGELLVEGTGEVINPDSIYSPWYDYRENILSATVRVKGATSAHGMFYDCVNLQTVDLKGFDTSKLTALSYMFSGCRSLTAVDVSTFNTSNVTNIGSMFSGCSSLTTLDLSCFDTSKVESMGYLVEYCDSLRKIDVSSFDTSNTRYLMRMFNKCPSLETLDLSSFVINYNFQYGNVDVDDMITCGPGLRELKTPKQIDSHVSIRLPNTDGSCSWRSPDGTKVSWLTRNFAGGIALRTDSHAGISFEGANFTLAEYPDTAIYNIEKVFPKGSKESFTFTIVPDAGYTVIPAVVPKFSSTAIMITQGETPYQYIVTPKDPELGYVHDEMITVTVATPATNTLDIKYDGQDIADFFFVANGKKLADHMATAIPADNNYDITVYVKPAPPREHYYTYEPVPVLTLETQDTYGNQVSRTIHSEKNTDLLTAEEKEFSKGGYYVLRLGRIYKKSSIEIRTVEMFCMTLTAEGFPEGYQIVRYVKNESGLYKEQPCSRETLIEAGEDLILQAKWDDPSDAHKWCNLQVMTRRTGATDWEFPEPITYPGVSGNIWKIDTLNGGREILFDLAPHRIELSYPGGDITDLTANTGGIRFSDDMHTIEVHSGDSFSISYTLDEALTMRGISVEGNGETAGIATLKDDGKGRWTVTVNNLPSRLYDISKINILVEDPKNRASLSDPNSEVMISYKENKRKPLVYRNEPIELDHLSVSVLYMNSYGKPIRRTLTLNTDYTAVYSNNINAGKAAVTITANPNSTKCRGQYVYYFTIRKAASFSIPEATFNVEAEQPQTDLSEMTIAGTYDKTVRPTGYRLVRWDKGDILSSEPVINGNIMTYNMRQDASINSTPAKITLMASFANYEDCQFDCTVHLVKREALVLGGNLVSDKVYDAMEFTPDPEGLQVISKEGTTPGAEEAATILGSIKSTLYYRYTGADGTTYDSETPPVDVGTYRLQAKVAPENTLYKSDWTDVGTFRITPREAVLTAGNITRYVNDTLPGPFEYVYTTEGLVYGDTVSGTPILSTDAQSTEKTGEYPIRITLLDAASKLLVQIINTAGKDVTANYRLTGKEGILRIEEPAQGSCTIIYNLSGKGNDIRRSGIAAGSLLPRPADPVAKGYKFLGWYLDGTLAKAWDFDADIVQGDTTLYAGWSRDLSAGSGSGMQLYVQEILPQTYTGKKITPAITVYAADGRTLLRKGKDYSVTYKNNMDADTKKFNGADNIPAGGFGADISDTSQGFHSGLAYAIITGKGNYTGTICMNFHINPVDISNAADTASDISLKYTESFEEKSGKYAAIVTQFKTRTATLKYKTDYTLTVNNTAGDAAVTLNDKGQLPLNSGTYRLSIAGQGNYTGSIEKELYVAAKSQLLKNAKVTCTGTISDVSKAQLAAGIEPQNLQVSINGTLLTEDTHYTVECSDNHAIGTATVKVKGMGGYFGSRSVTFKIRGIDFKEKEFGTVAVQDLTYSGTALTQNEVVLSKNGTPLIYGEDYTISYKNNIKRGKATMTFTANPSSGYSGSFKKTFKIDPLNLDSPDILLRGARKNDGTSRWTLSESVPYQKGGATPSDELKLQLSASGAFLTAGRDYTVKYKDNTEISEGKAYMTLTGKGNLTGSITVYFDISKASLAELYQAGIVSITPKTVRATFSYSRYRESPEDDYWEELKDPDYEFEPAITVKHGKQTLKEGTDYSVTYSGNVRNTLEDGGGTPTATITGIGNYAGILTEEDTPVTIPLSIYQQSLSNGTVYVIYEENTDFSYTGAPVLPGIKAVYFGKASDVSKARQNQETDESVLTEEKTPPDADNPRPDYAYGLTRLQQYSPETGGDYTISYGANTTKGKTGKIMISGVYNYGGKATITFTIDPKNIYSALEPADE